MRSWLAAHGYALRSALARFARRPVAAVFEVAVLGIALALPVAFLLAVENIRAVAARHPATPEVSVYLALDAGQDDADGVAEKLQGIAGAEEVRFVPKAQAAERMRGSPALAEVLDALPANPLPDAFTVRFAGADADRLEALQRELASWPHVARVQIDSGWARKLDALVHAGRMAAAALGLTLALAMLAVTFNTVRLQMLQQRDEIELARLIGATEAFLRRPYLYYGALQGMLGGGVAVALVALAQARVSQELAVLSAAYGVDLTLQPIPWEAVAAVLGGAAGLAYAAAWLCTARAARARPLRR